MSEVKIPFNEVEAIFQSLKQIQENPRCDETVAYWAKRNIEKIVKAHKVQHRKYNIACNDKRREFASVNADGNLVYETADKTILSYTKENAKKLEEAIEELDADLTYDAFLLTKRTPFFQNLPFLEQLSLELLLKFDVLEEPSSEIADDAKGNGTC